MNQDVLASLANNAALLLGLSIIYEISYLIPFKNQRFRPIFNGALITLICITIMSIPFTLKPGIIFDTRSILISVTALMFGLVPTLIATVFSVAYRLILGGSGALPGVAVITTSALIGLAWRRWFFPKSKRWNWLTIYVMSVIVHITMLACMLILPYPNNLAVISEIAFPVLLVYPVASILLSLLLIRQQEHRQFQNRLKQSEEKFQLLFDKAPLGYQSLDIDGNFIDVNQQWLDTLGYASEDVIGRWFGDFLTPSGRMVFRERFALLKEQGYSHNEYEMMHKNGNSLYMAFEAKIGYGADGEFLQTHCILQDITQQKKAIAALQESERSKSVLLSNLPGMAYRCMHDREWTMLFVSEGCFDLTGYHSDSLLGNKEVSFNDLILPEYREPLWNEWERILAKKSPFRHEYKIATATGEVKWVLEMGQGVYDRDNGIEALEGIIIDVTEQKTREAQIQHMNDHDFLTGLYNRKFFEDAKLKLDNEENFPLTIMIMDINGVRFTNEAFGHIEGDRLIKETAKILQSCCRSGDVLARVGGDEFGLLLPRTNNEEAYNILKKIHLACDVDKGSAEIILYEINLSIGYAIKETADENLDDISKSADEYLRNQKLLNTKSFHSNLISSIMATIYEKSHETEEHAKRLTVMSKVIGERLMLPQKNMGELELFAMLHDIGKVGIDDRVLKNPDQLKDADWAVMKTHTEIGYRIAKSSSELENIADYILTHHERWDGSGYPQGLKGDEIPILSRILAVVDAYDAMINKRIYREAMTHEEAIEEIRKNAGTQFDPQIAQIFIENFC